MNSSHRADDMKSHLEMSPLRNKSLPLRPPGDSLQMEMKQKCFYTPGGKTGKHTDSIYTGCQTCSAK